jgi:catechol 2,3-dioxygenase-like lactoylglutathione lyase family enzyme
LASVQNVRVQTALRAATNDQDHRPRASDARLEITALSQGSVFCFRVEDRAAVDRVAKRFSELGIECSAPQLYPEYAPDYYAIFFRDPDGIQLEVTNYRQERRKRFADWDDA